MNLFAAMQLFVQVIEAGNFSAAAELLDRDRSQVSRQIAALEKYLGTKLIHRTTRNLSLTSAGAKYLTACQEILAQVEVASSQLANENQQLQGLIRISLPLSFGLIKGQAWLIDFMQQHPEIELKVHFSDAPINLIEEGFDVALRITNRLEETTIARYLGECQLLTLAAPSYLAKYGQPQHPKELAEHSCLGYFNQSSNQAWQYMIDNQLTDFYFNSRLQANNGDALAQAAAKGLGLVVVPDFIATQYLATQELKVILNDFAPPALGIYAVLASNRFIPQRLTQLLEFIKSQLNASAVKL